jgi:TonB-dependent SusC/RagA subfamily outer membrane receptor
MKKFMLAASLLTLAASAVHAQQPILIVNGVRIDKCQDARATTAGDKLALPDIDRAAIDKVEVLKGAAAAKMYGADAANGVITITLKPGAVASPTLCGTPRTDPVFIVDGVVQPSGSPALSRPAPDPIGRYLYAPEVVMAHQQAIGLTDRQRSAIQDLVKDLQSKAMDTQMKLAATGEKLSHSLAAASVDEASVLQQIDHMLALEREVKRAQMTLLVRIKNQLTPAQQGMLDKMK